MNKAGVPYESAAEKKRRLDEERTVVKRLPREEPPVEKAPSRVPMMGDLDIIDSDPEPVEEHNPLKTIEKLITRDDIDIKTVLSQRQLIIMHRLGVVENVFRTEAEKGDPVARECEELMGHFGTRFFELAVNQNGLSREQLIKGIHRAEEREGMAGSVNLNTPVLKVQ